MILVVLQGSVASGAPQLAAQCPVDPEDGYRVAVAWAGEQGPGAEYLAAFARAAAYRWVVPSRRRDAYAGWVGVLERILPPEPRWADDWSPQSRHRAELLVTVGRNGRVRLDSVVARSGDQLFDRSLNSIVDGPLPASPAFPPLPGGFPEDEVELRLLLGHEELPEPHGLVRFAAQQTPVRVGSLDVRGRISGVEITSGPVRPPPRPDVRATIKYDVTPAGTVDRASIQVLTASSVDAERAIVDALLRVRFPPAQSNCRPVAVTVVQTFGR